MIIVSTRREPSATTPSRRYHSRAERLAMVEDLPAHRGPDGRVPGYLVNATALQYGRSKRQVSRALQELGSPEPARREWQLPHELKVRTAMYRGNLHRALEEMRLEVLNGVADWDLRSYPTAARALSRDPGLRIALSKGIEAFKKFLLVGSYEAAYRNELHYIDAMHVPIQCLDQYGRLVEDLWLITVFDAFSRCALAWACFLGEPTGEITAAVILSAALGQVIPEAELQAMGIQHDGPAFVGGAGDTLMLDNALANKSEEVRHTSQLVGTRHQFAEPMTPTDKAKLERFHWTLQLRLASLPGYVRRDQKTGHQVIPIPLPPTDRLPRVEAVIEVIDHEIKQYNASHEVSTTGSTPLARFLHDGGPIRALKPILAWPQLWSLGTYQVHPRGVKLPGGFRSTVHPDFLPGRHVEVRYLPGMPSRTFFGIDGRFADEVRLHAEIGDDERVSRKVQNAKRSKDARSVLREAGGRVLTEGSPLVDAEVAAPGPRRRKDLTPRQDAHSAGIAAIRSLEWRPAEAELPDNAA